MYSKVMVNVFRIAVIAVVIIAILGTVAGFAAFKGILDTTTPIELAVLEVKGYTSTSLYSDGTIAQNFAGPSANRIEITMEQVPDSVKYAFMAAEDHRFYEHNGIDIRTIFRSGFSLFREGANPGGSTFTQQLIKNQVFGGGGETYFIDKVQRKIQEQYLAINLEHVSSKDEIFAYYLNMVNLGNRTYGVETASLGYFGKSVSELTVSEAAVLAAIPLSPTRMNPITHPEENAKRRESTLRNMLEYGFITEEEFNEAMGDDVYTRIAENSNNNEKVEIGQYSYFTDAMLTELYRDLQERLGYTYEEAKNLVFYGGITIYTTQVLNHLLPGGLRR